ncbi:MAG: TOBE domain-containing protein, partial [Melioribacteraceae bacterium]
FIGGKIVNENGLKFQSVKKDLTFEIPEKYKISLSNYIIEDITLGVRPEDILLKEYSMSQTNHIMNVNLEVVEPMGNEIFLYFKLSDNQIVARVQAVEGLDEGLNIDLMLNINKLHFFDNRTEDAISY